MNLTMITILFLSGRLVLSRASTRSEWDLVSEGEPYSSIQLFAYVSNASAIWHPGPVFLFLFFPRPIVSISPLTLGHGNIDLSKLWDSKDSQDECIPTLLIIVPTFTDIRGEINQQFLRLAKFPPNCDWLHSLLSPCVFCGCQQTAPFQTWCRAHLHSFLTNPCIIFVIFSMPMHVVVQKETNPKELPL